MFRTTILSLTAAFAVAALSTSSDAQPYRYRWYGKPITADKLKSYKTQFMTCGRGMRLGRDGNCYPILN